MILLSFSFSTSLTTEIFFSRHDWNILVEEVNAHQELPVGMATYTAANVSSGIWKDKGTEVL